MTPEQKELNAIKRKIIRMGSGQPADISAHIKMMNRKRELEKIEKERKAQ